MKEAIESCDVFIFAGQTFHTSSRDLAILKALGKKIVVFFMGSEQRWKSAFEQEMRLFNIPSCYPRLDRPYETKRKKLQRTLNYLRNAERYADVIYSLPNQSQLSLRPYSQFYIPVDTSIIPPASEQRIIPIVAHAPSNRGVKGTDIVLAVLNRLKREGFQFEIRLIENVPYRRALEMYADSDILIGELFTPSGGRLDREALAAECVVLSSLRREYIDNVPAECPIIDVNPDTLYEELKRIIPDLSYRVMLARKGGPYVQKYHALHSVCGNILNRLAQPRISNNYDFYPRFFREAFLPEKDSYCRLYNRWTEYVQDCDWYKENVPPGERAGLEF